MLCVSQASAADHAEWRESSRCASALAAIEARQRLRGSSHWCLRKVRCDYHEGILTLRGAIPSFYLRQVVQRLTREIPGVEQIVDRLEVVELTARIQSTGPFDDDGHSMFDCLDR